MLLYKTYFLSRLLVIIVSFYSDSNNARLVHNLLDDLTIFSDDLA